jgi:hypothetical protein
LKSNLINGGDELMSAVLVFEGKAGLSQAIDLLNEKYGFCSTAISELHREKEMAVNDELVSARTLIAMAGYYPDEMHEELNKAITSSGGFIIEPEDFDAVDCIMSEFEVQR